MEIRRECPGDQDAIRGVITAAFLAAEHSGGNEAGIVDRLREAESLAVSLVAIENHLIVGHVAFSAVAIDGRADRWFGLGPVSVAPDRQRQGIGRALIEAGLAALRERGAKGCVVLGDPEYYRRLGFAARPELRLAGVPPEYFQQIAFDEHPCRGLVTYHCAFEVR